MRPQRLDDLGEELLAPDEIGGGMVGVGDHGVSGEGLSLGDAKLRSRWHSELGWALFGLHDDAGAQESARLALRLQPANAGAHLLLGVLLSPSAATRPEGLWHMTEGSYYLQRPRGALTSR